MPTLVHFVKTDATTRTTASTTGAELTDYTIPWATLTGAGFAAGDDVLILVAVKDWNSGVNNNTYFAVGFGTTFAGRAEVADSVQRAEPIGTDAGEQYFWFDRRTLVVNENIYFRGMTTAGTASYNELVANIFKLTGLAASDWAYATTNPNAVINSTTFADGATVTTAAAGDWLWMTCTRWLGNTLGEYLDVAITDGVVGDVMSYRTTVADVDDERVFGTMLYSDNLASGATVRNRHRTSAASGAVLATTKLFGLRLEICQDHDGVTTIGSPITHSVIDTYQEVAGFPSYSKTATGPFVVLGMARSLNASANTRRPYGRIQIGEADWPAANANRQPIGDNGPTAVQVLFLFGHNASQVAATLDIDLDCAEDASISPTYTTTDRVAVAFSLELAAAGATVLPSNGSLILTGQAPTWSVISRFAPDSVLASSNLRDTLSNAPPTRLADIDEAVDADDTEWFTAINPAAVTDVRVGLAAPPASALIGTQQIRVLIRATSLPARDVTIELWENGAKLTSEVTASVISSSGQIVTLSFQASEVTDPAAVEVRIVAEAA